MRDDINARGLREPILMKSGHVVDGRHRLRACRELGIEPTFQEYAGSDIVAEVWSRNGLRRHLTPDQRAMYVAKMRGNKLSKDAQARMKSTLKHGETTPATLKSAERGEAAEKIAKEANVGRDKARAALRVLKSEPGIVDDVIAGKKPLASVAKKPKRKRKAPPELPPYEPKPDEQARLDAVEAQIGKLASALDIGFVELAARLDSIEKQRWLNICKPVTAFFKALAGPTW